MNGYKKLLVTIGCVIVLAACQAETDKKEDVAVSTGLILQEAISQEENEILPEHTGYIGDSSWENEKTLLVQYRDAGAPAEYQNEFYIETNGKQVIYRFTNKGDYPFSWQIITPDDRTWNSGELNPGQSKTFEAQYKEGYMPRGHYTFSIVSSVNQDSIFDFVITAPE